MWVTFGGVALVAVVLLGAAIVLGPLADAWHPVVTINDVTVDRTELRNRLKLDEALLGMRKAALRTAAADGRLDPAESDRIIATLDSANADPLRAAIDGLVQDELVRRAARERGLEPDGDTRRELGLASTADLGVPIRVVTLEFPLAQAHAGANDWPAPPPPGAPDAEVEAARQRALAAISTALSDGALPGDIASGLVATGWRSTGADTWLARAGPRSGLPAEIIVNARDPGSAVGSVIGPVVDRVSAVAAVAVVQARGSETFAPAEEIADRPGIDAGTLARWAEARAAESSLRLALADGWRTQPQDQVRVAEIVVGSADLEGVEGEHRSFAHLVVGQLPASVRLPGSTVTGEAERLAVELRGLPLDERLARFAELMGLANGTPSDDPLKASGEIGFFTKDQLLPPLGDRAFSDGVETGDVIGPIDTVVGPELFIVRAAFEGVLDERANAALVEVRMTSDLGALARRISPAGQAQRADGTLWRATAEALVTPAVRRAYQETPIEALSDPVVLDGQIVVVRALERRTGPLDPAALARLLVGGFDVWLADHLAGATIIRDPEPLPGVIVEASPPPGSSIPVETPDLPAPPTVNPGGGNPVIPIPTMPAPSQ